MVTGGIGSGKSTVTRLLGRLGFRVVDADQLARETLEPGGDALSAVAARWPEATVDGAVDRGKLASIVFTDEEALRELEAYIHPLVRRRIAEYDELAGSDPLAVEVSVPTDLVGPGWLVVVVDAPEELRRRRLEERGMDPADVDRRLRSQPGRQEWLGLADFVLRNDGDEERLRSQVEALVERLLHRAEPLGGSSRDDRDVAN